VISRPVYTFSILNKIKELLIKVALYHFSKYDEKALDQELTEFLEQNYIETENLTLRDKIVLFKKLIRSIDSKIEAEANSELLSLLFNEMRLKEALQSWRKS
jgi:hypothetical protein